MAPRRRDDRRPRGRAPEHDGGRRPARLSGRARSRWLRACTSGGRRARRGRTRRRCRARSIPRRRHRRPARVPCLLDTLAAIDPARAEAVRADTMWGAGRRSAPRSCSLRPTCSRRSTRPCAPRLPDTPPTDKDRHVRPRLHLRRSPRQPRRPGDPGAVHARDRRLADGRAVPRRPAGLARGLRPIPRGSRPSARACGPRSPRSATASAGRRTRRRSSPIPRTRRDDGGAGSASVVLPDPVPLWDVLEVRLDGPSHGNPFVDVELGRRLHAAGERELRVGGLLRRRRRLPDPLHARRRGRWAFVTRSHRPVARRARRHGSLSAPARAGRHGPVRVRRPSTSATPTARAASPARHDRVRVDAPGRRARRSRRCARWPTPPFTKLRMCVFPKSYLYNANEPRAVPVRRVARGRASTSTRFDAALLPPPRAADRAAGRARHRGGPDPLPRLRPVGLRRPRARPPTTATCATSCARLAAFAERLVVDGQRVRPAVVQGRRPTGSASPAIVGEDDPFGHLHSIHNCRPFYDYTTARGSRTRASSASTSTAPRRTPTSGASGGASRS